MKTVKATTIEDLHRGIAIVFSTNEGPVSLAFTKPQARLLVRQLYMKIGSKRGDKES